VNRLPLLCLSFVILGSGCAPKTNDAVGSYERSTGALWEEIVLKKDMTFDQKVRYKNGRIFQISGTWKLTHRQLSLSHAFVTHDVVSNTPYDPPVMTNGINFAFHGKALEHDFQQNYILMRTSSN
jgi:hypothetical protein